MSLRGAAHIVGAFEHPARVLPDHSVAQIHAEVAAGALADAGLTFDDVDGYFCAGDSPGLGVMSMAEHLGVKVRHMDSTDSGGSATMVHVGHALAAIAAGKCSVALVTLGGKPRSSKGTGLGLPLGVPPEVGFEVPFGTNTSALYALAAQRHMYEFGTTSAQLAEIKASASRHAALNPNAFLRTEVTVDDVLSSPMVSSPLHRLDCCVITDGGGALVVVSPEVARDLERRSVTILGHGEAVKHSSGGDIDLTYTAAVWSGAAAYAEAGVTAADIDYAGIYDSFTITVLLALEDLGFCEKGEGGRFVADGALDARGGRLPVNTDGGSLCNNHPANRGGMTKIIEAVRQLRGEAHPDLQVANCEIALAHGTGGSIGTKVGNATVILGQEDS